MSSVKLHYFIFGFLFQILINNTNAKPACPGECYDCGPVGPAPIIVPIPQPVPVRPPPPSEGCHQQQSVTIPNIILALLPPTNKPLAPLAPKPKPPVIRPPPAVFPPFLPQFYPLPAFANSGAFGNSFGGFGGYGNGCGGGCGCS